MDNFPDGAHPITGVPSKMQEHYPHINHNPGMQEPGGARAQASPKRCEKYYQVTPTELAQKKNIRKKSRVLITKEQIGHKVLSGVWAPNIDKMGKIYAELQQAILWEYPKQERI